MSNATVPDLRSSGTLASAMFPGGAPFLDAIGTDADDFRAAARLLSAMAEYCDLIGAAHDLRTQGNVDGATRLESRAERIYNRLPAGARW